jgi:carbon storage regulator
MLRITRKTGERVMLGDDVVVEVLEVRGQTVRLGIDAPRSLVIYREEIWLEVKRENEAAALAASAPMPSVRLKSANSCNGPLAGRLRVTTESGCGFQRRCRTPSLSMSLGIPDSESTNRPVSIQVPSKTETE